MNNRRAGFTLIELTAALALVGLLFAGFWAVLDQLGDSHKRILEEAKRQDTVANGARTLRALLFAAEAGADSASRFIGDDSTASFSSWCPVPAGWQQPCRVNLRVVPFEDSTAVTAVLSTGEQFVLWRDAGAGSLRYYNAAVSSTGWANSWGFSIAVPTAIGLQFADRMVIFGAGGR